MTTVKFAGKMIDGTEFKAEADRDLVIKALKMELSNKGDLAVDDFVYNNFELNAGIAVNAMLWNTENYLITVIDLIKHGDRFAVCGAITDYGCGANFDDALQSLASGEY